MKSLEFQFDLNKNKAISKWNVLIFTFTVVFLFTFLQNLGISFKAFNFIGTPHAKNYTFNKILPRLQKTPNDYKLKKQSSIIVPTFASSVYDNASSYVAVDYNTGDVILQKDSSSKLPIASLTKIMTAMVSLDLANPSDQLTISREAASQEPTTIGVVENQKMSVEELLNASLLTSANDAAQALKDGINKKYNSEIFVEAMNAKAKFLGLKNTNFSNPQGFDNGQNYSSAEDLAIATHYALKNYLLIANIVKKDYQFIPATKNHKQFDLYNWNGLLDVYPGVEGVKIGNTDGAKYTNIILSQREGKKILVVLLGAPGVLERDLWASAILDDSFLKLANLSPVNITQTDLRQKYSTWKYWN